MKTVALIGLICAGLAALPRAGLGEPAIPENTPNQHALDAAVDRGLDYLTRSQAADGSIGGNTPANTALAIMAFLARGYPPGLPPHGNVINRGIDYILSVPSVDGRLIGGGGQMTSHTISTLLLSEVSGMVDPERQARIDAVLPWALRIILTAQDAKAPDPTSNDSNSTIFHSGWALMALRSARNNGAPIPTEAIEKAVQSILLCRTPEGGFADQPGGTTGVASTGIGLLGLELAGRHRDDVTLRAGQYIAGRFEKGEPFAGERRYDALYYSACGLFQLGDPEWEAFAPRLYDAILKRQSSNGAWSEGGKDPSQPYSTSMAILALSVSCRPLPVNQR